MAYTEKYVTTAGAGGHTGVDEANAWTMEEACDNVADGQRVNVKANASYTTEYATGGVKDCVMYIVTAGTEVNGGIHWRGYHTTIGDGGIVTIDAQDALANPALTAINGDVYNIFENFNFKQGTGAGFEGGNDDYMVFKKCRFGDNGTDGVNVDNYCRFVACLAEINGTGSGFNSDTLSMFFACIAQNNGDDGFHAGSSAVFYNSLAYNNAAHDFSAVAGEGAVLGCSCDGENAANDYGFYQDSATSSSYTVINNIFFDCDIGIKSDVDVLDWAISCFNVFDSSNTSDTNNWLTPSLGAATPGVDGKGDIVDPGDPFDNSAGRIYTPVAAVQAKGLDAFWTQSFWADYNDGAGDNPPAE